MAQHQVEMFDCGNEPLNQYLKRLSLRIRGLTICRAHCIAENQMSLRSRAVIHAKAGCNAASGSTSRSISFSLW